MNKSLKDDVAKISADKKEMKANYCKQSKVNAELQVSTFFS